MQARLISANEGKRAGKAPVDVDERERFASAPIIEIHELPRQRCAQLFDGTPEEETALGVRLRTCPVVSAMTLASGAL